MGQALVTVRNAIYGALALSSHNQNIRGSTPQQKLGSSDYSELSFPGLLSNYSTLNSKTAALPIAYSDVTGFTCTNRTYALENVLPSGLGVQNLAIDQNGTLIQLNPSSAAGWSQDPIDVSFTVVSVCTENKDDSLKFTSTVSFVNYIPYDPLENAYTPTQSAMYGSVLPQEIYVCFYNTPSVLAPRDDDTYGHTYTYYGTASTPAISISSSGVLTIAGGALDMYDYSTVYSVTITRSSNNYGADTGPTQPATKFIANVKLDTSYSCGT